VWRWHGDAFDLKPSEEHIEAEKAKAKEYREKNRERINANKRAYALKLRTERKEAGRVRSIQDGCTTNCGDCT
jgi:hypothetical protein